MIRCRGRRPGVRGGLLPVHGRPDGARVAGGRRRSGRTWTAPALAATVGLDRGRPRRRAAGRHRGGRGAVRLPAGPAGRRGAGRAGRRPRWRAATAEPDGLAVVAVDRGGRHGAPADVRARSWAWHEDPATGSAAVALGVFLAARGVLGRTGRSVLVVTRASRWAGRRRWRCTRASSRGRGRRSRSGASVRHGGNAVSSLALPDRADPPGGWGVRSRSPAAPAAGRRVSIVGPAPTPPSPTRSPP